jgi:DNA primase
MDAIMAHQHGYHTVVATLGTAITEQHLRVLRRHVDEIRLALDPDAAGQAATWRALQLADASLRSGLAPVVGPNRRQQRFVADRAARLLVMALPDGKDPDDLIRGDPNAWTALVRQAAPVVDFVLERLAARHDLATAHGKAAAAEEVVEVLAGIANPIEQDHYVQRAADALKVDPDAIRRVLRRQQRAARLEGPSPTARPGPEQQPAAEAETSDTPPIEISKGDADDEYLLALVMHLRALAQVPPIDGEPEFILAEHRALYRALQAGEPVPPELVPSFERAQRRLADVQRLPPHRLAAEVDLTRKQIRRKLILERLQQLSQLLREGADRTEVEPLLDQALQELGAIARQLPPEPESVGPR